MKVFVLTINFYKYLSASGKFQVQVIIPVADSFESKLMQVIFYFQSNLIIDKRFGEFDENLTPEEKMLKRFTLEKQVH